MSHAPVSLYAECKTAGGLPLERIHGLGARHVIVGEVELHHGKYLAIEGQEVPVGDVRRIEDPFPILILEPRRSDQKHCGHPA